MKGKAIIVILFLLALIILVPIIFRPKDAVAPVKEVDTQNKEEVVDNTIVTKTEIEGSKEDLVSFSIAPGQEVSGIMKITGVLSGGYFFEGNLPVSILDENKNLTSYGPGHGQATTDWMTKGEVSFAIDFDFNKIPKGNYYIKLMQDDPSGGESGKPIKSILIPIIIK